MKVAVAGADIVRMASLLLQGQQVQFHIRFQDSLDRLAGESEETPDEFIGTWTLSASQREGQFETCGSRYRTLWPTYVYLQKSAGHQQSLFPFLPSLAMTSGVVRVSISTPVLIIAGESTSLTPRIVKTPMKTYRASGSTPFMIGFIITMTCTVVSLMNGNFIRRTNRLSKESLNTLRMTKNRVPTSHAPALISAVTTRSVSGLPIRTARSPIRRRLLVIHLVSCCIVVPSPR